MAIITKYELDSTDQGQVTRMIREAVAAEKGMPWDGEGHDGVWKHGLSDFVPMLTPTGYYPQDSRNGFDDKPVRSMEYPEFARQVALALDALASCPKQLSDAFAKRESSWGIAETITIKTGQPMSVGAVVLAALTAGFTLTTLTGYGDELFVADISSAALRIALAALPREVSHA